MSEGKFFEKKKFIGVSATNSCEKLTKNQVLVVRRYFEYRVNLYVSLSPFQRLKVKENLFSSISSFLGREGERQRIFISIIKGLSSMAGCECGAEVEQDTAGIKIYNLRFSFG